MLSFVYPICRNHNNAKNYYLYTKLWNDDAAACPEILRKCRTDPHQFVGFYLPQIYVVRKMVYELSFILNKKAYSLIELYISLYRQRVIGGRWLRTLLGEQHSKFTGWTLFVMEVVLTENGCCVSSVAYLSVGRVHYMGAYLCEYITSHAMLT